MAEKTLSLPDDYEGAVVARLVEAQPETENHSFLRAVLYIHGYVDYFFQNHMAEAFTRAGIRFFALDLRKYGRSLLPHQHLNYCRDLREYYPEIDRSINEIRGEGYADITLLGHSTGGLLAALYCAEDGHGGNRRKYIDRLILNSPFLAFNASWFTRQVMIPVSGLISRTFPYAATKNRLSPFYARSVHRSMEGEWEYNLEWKPAEGMPLYLAWLRAIRRGQKRVKRGLGIPVPVLVMHSDRSSWEKQWNPILKQTDAVLNVNDIRKRAPRLGSQVSLLEIAGGMHDLVLSPRPVREQALGEMIRWIKAQE